MQSSSRVGEDGMYFYKKDEDFDDSSNDVQLFQSTFATYRFNNSASYGIPLVRPRNGARRATRKQ